MEQVIESVDDLSAGVFRAKEKKEDKEEDEDEKEEVEENLLPIIEKVENPKV